MTRHRTTARAALALAALVGLGAGAAAAHNPPAESAAKQARKQPIVFPLLGTVRWGNSYGDPRANGSHAGIDIEGAPRRSPVVAAEAGTVKFWTTSARAGCMLYLYGASGTTYLYIHLNNDLTLRNDNRGQCVPGVAYMKGLANGSRVEAGEQIAYNGDSGDADGNPHLHFEVHPNDGPDVNPFAYLKAATHVLFPGAAGRPSSVALRGAPVAAGDGTMDVRVSSVRWWPNGRWTPIEERVVTVVVPPEADVPPALLEAISSPGRRELAGRKSTSLTVFTARAPLTAEAQRGEPGALVAARVKATG